MTHPTPQFALLAMDFGLWAGYGTSFFVTLMFITLANVQEFIEDPFVLPPPPLTQSPANCR